MSLVFALAHPLRISRGVATNLLARVSPGAYARVSGDTGRGNDAGKTPADIATYFRYSFDQFFVELGIKESEVASFLNGKRVVEYGPGDVPAVAVLMIAHGAAQVTCTDRFPLSRFSPLSIEILGALIHSLTGEQRERADACFLRSGDVSSGIDPTRIRYVVNAHGLTDLHAEADLVVSTAVMEHVDQLEQTYADAHTALVPGGSTVHVVDLSSHGTHADHPLDFLAWPSVLWSLMYGSKGAPNRWRQSHHRSAIEKAGFASVKMRTTQSVDVASVPAVRWSLDPRFRSLTADDLAVTGFWVTATKPAKPIVVG
jgi:hypothetical protein